MAVGGLATTATTGRGRIRAVEILLFAAGAPLRHFRPAAEPIPSALHAVQHPPRSRPRVAGHGRECTPERHLGKPTPPVRAEGAGARAPPPGPPHPARPPLTPRTS